MLGVLSYILSGPLKPMLFMPEIWDSIVINRRKPHTYRIFTTLALPSYPGVDTVRISLHRFDRCNKSESFLHPHAWPAAFKILKGGYFMLIGTSETLFNDPTEFHTLNLKSGSSYEMVKTNEWHSITPYEETFTIMVNGPNYEKPHASVRTTKGKDLESLPKDEIQDYLQTFRELLK